MSHKKDRVDVGDLYNHALRKALVKEAFSVHSITDFYHDFGNKTKLMILLLLNKAPAPINFMDLHQMLGVLGIKVSYNHVAKSVYELSSDGLIKMTQVKKDHNSKYVELNRKNVLNRMGLLKASMDLLADAFLN